MKTEKKTFRVTDLRALFKFTLLSYKKNKQTAVSQAPYIQTQVSYRSLDTRQNCNEESIIIILTPTQ